MIFKTTLKDINAVAVAIDKLGKITSANMSKNTIEYTLYGKAIEGLSAKQLALVLSTQKLTPLQIEQIIDENKLIKTYGAEVLVKEGLISANSTLLASEKSVSAEKLKASILQSATNEEQAKEFIQKNLIVAANGEEAASTVILNKALMDEAVERGILSEEKAAEILSTYGVVTADVAEIGSKKSLAKATRELIASKINLSKVDVGMIAGVAALVFTIYKCNKAVQEAREKAQELGSEFKETSSNIDDYKLKIEELYKTINDSTSSIEDVTNARKSLLSIQNELIDKFGTEESVINNVTDAINGQTNALDRLSKAKWEETKNEFTHSGFWNDAANFFEGKDNIDRMLDEYGEKTILFKWADYADINKLTDEMVAELENIGIDIKVSTDNLQAIRDFDSLTESIEDTKGASLSLSGNAEEIYNKLLALQNLIGSDDSFDKLYNKIGDTADSYKKLTEQYKDFYAQYILQEKIFADDSKYADTFKNITDAAEKYNEAFESGDQVKIKEAADEYAKTVSDAMDNAIANGDSDVADYFENMYPTLKSIVDGWVFNIAFNADETGLQEQVQSVLDKLKDENGRSLTAEEILGLGSENEQYQALVAIARAYNMTLEKMIELLKERNLVSAMDYQGLVGLFGQKNVNKLSPEDLEIAYTIKNVGTMTFEQLQSEIQKTKEFANENPISFSSSLTKSEESLDKFQSSVKSAAEAYTTLLSGDYSSTELLDSIQAINKAASDMGESIDWESIDSMDELSDAIESVSNAYAESALSDAGIDTDSKFGQMLANIIQEAYKSEAALSSLNAQIDSLQSAYDDLTNIVGAYNETGYITFGQLQTLLAMEPQYLSCLIDENGQLRLNQEAMTELANQRLNDARAQVIQQAVTELGELAHKKEQAAIEDSRIAMSDNMETMTEYEQKLLRLIPTVGLATSEFVDLSNAINGATQDGVSDENIDNVINNMEKKLRLIENSINHFPGLNKIMGKKEEVTEVTEILDKFQSSVKSAGDAYTTLLTGNYSSSELLDSIQAINQAVKDMDGSLDWDNIDSLDVLGEKLGDISRQYAASILSDAGIDTDSKLGQILANIIQETYVVEARFTAMNDSLDTLQSSVKSAGDAYATLLSGHYTSSELLDSIQAIAKAAKDMGKTIDWEAVSRSADPLRTIQGTIEAVSKSYADSILSGAGIDVDSKFGQMLADIVEQTYEAEARFKGMNAQLDRLQDSYQTLTDIIGSYNKNGYVSLDSLQKLLTADENLVKMLQVENGQLVINQKAYKNLVAVQLMGFKAKLDDAAAAEIESLALDKAGEATARNARASENAVAKLNAETEAFNRNTSAAMANAMTKAENAGVSDAEIQGVLQKYTEIWNAAMNNYSADFSSFMGAGEDAGKAFREALEKELEALDKKMDAGYMDFNDYIQARRNLIESYYSQAKISADEYYSYLESHYSQELSYMGKAINAVTRGIDRQISLLNKQKENLNKNYQSELDSLNKRKEALEAERDAMQEANQERQNQVDLGKEIYNLNRAQNQRNQLLYTEKGGVIYKEDTSAIREAKEKIDDIHHEMEIDRIEKSIKEVSKSIANLEEAHDTEISSIDDMISKLEEYKDSWNDVTSAYEEEQEDLIAAQILGAGWESTILNGRLDVLENFKEQYTSIQKAITDAAWKAAEEQAKAAQEAAKSTSTDVSADVTATVPDANIAATATTVTATATVDTPAIVDTSNTKLPEVSKVSNTQKLPAKPAVRPSGTNTASSSASPNLDKIKPTKDLNFQKYGSGTDHAEKGLNLVGEDGTELYFDNHDHVAIVEKPTLIPMEGGEVVKNEQETKELLSGNNPMPSDVGGTLMNDSKMLEKLKKQNRRPIQPGDPGYDLIQKANAFFASGKFNRENFIPSSAFEYNKQMGEFVKKVTNISNTINNRNIQPIVNNIHVTCPGVTEQQVAEKLGSVMGKELDKQFSGFHNYVDQQSRIK